ncbi:MAG: hypothetical protein DRI57_11470, partial [Deltaproteobacteria bacterium]
MRSKKVFRIPGIPLSVKKNRIVTGRFFSLTLSPGYHILSVKTAQKRRKTWKPHESYLFPDSRIRSLSGKYRKIPPPDSWKMSGS